MLLHSLFITSSLAQDLGQWDHVGSAGAACVHLVLLPNDRILCWERPHIPPYPPNPNTGGILATEIHLKHRVNPDGTWVSQFTPNHVRTSPFCGGQSQAAEGGIFVAGGDGGLWVLSNGTQFYEDGHQGRRTYTPCTTPGCQVGTWRDLPDMTTRRWYPTVTTLHDGRHIIVGGVTTNIDLSHLSDNNNPTYEYYPSKGGQWPRHLDLLAWAYPFCLYPLVFQLPSRNIMMMAANKSIILNPATEQVTFTIPDLIAPDHAPFIYPFTPTYVTLPLTRKNNFKVEFMVCGGTKMSTSQTTKDASAQCWKIAPEEPNPRWVRMDDMPNPRVMPDSVILSDGKIIFVNGGRHGTAGGLAGEAQYAWDPAYSADMFDPEAPSGSQWTQLASATNIRLYHSEAILVESGHVITAGSEMNNYGDYWLGRGGPQCYPNGPNACSDPFNYNLERFAPPYLQRAARNGRPEIANIPQTVSYNTNVDIEMNTGADRVFKVNMVRYSSATHSVNTDQKLVELVIVARTKTTLTVRIPWNSALAQPGNWMVFCLDADDVPSVGRTILLRLPPTGPIEPTDPSILPSPVPVFPQTGTRQVDASNSNSASQATTVGTTLLGLLALLF